MTALMQENKTDLDSLANQLLENRNTTQKLPEASIAKEDIQPVPKEDLEDSSEPKETKKFQFKKGEQVFEVDEDAEIEMMADKNPVRLKLSELRDRAAGDIAIKNRMHSLAEEKKKVQATFKEFSSIAKNDPLKALEYISNKANEADSEFAYEKYLGALAKQAEALASMDEKDRKAFMAEKKLQEVEEDLSLARQEAFVAREKQGLMEKFGVTESQFNYIADGILGNSEIMSEVRDDHDFMDKVRDVLKEANSQKKAQEIIKGIDPKLSKDESLIFEISDLMHDNPDFNEADIAEIVQGAISINSKKQAEMRLSAKQRSSSSMEDIRMQGASEYSLLAEQLLEEKEKRKNNKR